MERWIGLPWQKYLQVERFWKVGEIDGWETYVCIRKTARGELRINIARISSRTQYVAQGLDFNEAQAKRLFYALSRALVELKRMSNAQ